jgi:hypothetical protein
MPSARALLRALATGTVALLPAGCALPVPESNSSSSGYPGYPRAGGGYTGSSSANRYEYRGPLPAGSYTESCREMRVDRDRHHLEAECQGRDGRWRDTHLDLRECDRGIVNDDGRLACPRAEIVRLPAGSYRESCRDFSVDKNRLGARCRRRNGDWQDTAIDLKTCKAPIRNDDGRLVCG